MIRSITPFLWFDSNAEEAARLYASIFPESSIDNVSPMSVTFTLQGQKFIGLNGGPTFTFTPAISLFVSVETQAEVDTLWDALLGSVERRRSGEGGARHDSDDANGENRYRRLTARGASRR